MKWIEAIIRPEREDEVIDALEKSGIFAYTRIEVSGRGRQKGLVAGSVHYEELPKICLMLALPEEEADRALETIKIAGRTGNPGDGKLFVSALAEVRSLRTGTPD